IAAGVAYVTDSEHRFRAFDLATGSEVGSGELPGGPGAIAVAGGTLYVTSQNTLFAFVSSAATPVSQVAPTPTRAVEASPTSAGAGVQVTHLWTAHLGIDAIAFAPDGSVWVQDFGGTVWIFDRDGNLLDTWGKAGSGPGELAFKIPGEDSWWG